VTTYIRDNPGQFRIISQKACLEDYAPDVRISLDTPEDYALLCILFDYLYPKNRYFNVTQIVKLFKEKPWLKLINQRISQKKEGLSLQQELKEGIKILNLQDLKKASKYLAECTKTTQVRLRRVKAEDCNDLWNWRNHPEVRKWCFSPEKVDLRTHKEWFLKKIKDPNTLIYIALNRLGEKIGQIRFDLKNDSAFVSISLNPIFFNKGYGSKVIEQGTSLCLHAFKNAKQCLAEIIDSNIVSKNAFIKAGYKFWKYIRKGGKKTALYLARRSR
jgi:RimJ/RimL family protein N-acetyltransferase